MNLAILGAGNVGDGLAAAAGKAGHPVTVPAAEPLALLDISLNATRGWDRRSAFRLVGPQTSAA